ncbi:MAG: hypothetical protein K2H85_06895 [Allobaculum sp.]|nr:hypothetical protein [Allobaculum sp.]
MALLLHGMQASESYQTYLYRKNISLDFEFGKIGINTADDFSNRLVEAYGSNNVRTTNLGAATIYKQYDPEHKTYCGFSYGSWDTNVSVNYDFTIPEHKKQLLLYVPTIFSIDISFIPNWIQFKAYLNNAQKTQGSYNQWGITLENLDTGDISVPIQLIDFSSVLATDIERYGVLLNECKTSMNEGYQAGDNYFDLTINLETQCPDSLAILEGATKLRLSWRSPKTFWYKGSHWATLPVVFSYFEME